MSSIAQTLDQIQTQLATMRTLDQGDAAAERGRVGELAEHRRRDFREVIEVFGAAPRGHSRRCAVQVSLRRQREGTAFVASAWEHMPHIVVTWAMRWIACQIPSVIAAATPSRAAVGAVN